MEIHQIENDADHQRALKRIDEIWEAKPGTPEYEELDRLATLIDAYENEHYPLGEE